MPKKYHVPVSPAPALRPPLSRFTAVEVEGCLGCLKCVKRTSCMYRAYTRREFDPSAVVDSVDTACINCLRCVQECKKNILSRAKNPRFEAMGDDYWKPELIASLWRQAETGKIPVSGAGYRGPFSGPGFDQMWTDMSEIVRPTRDGIHGREYISTMIELGRKWRRLQLDANGKLAVSPPPFHELPLPIIFELPRRSRLGENGKLALAQASQTVETLLLVSQKQSETILREYQKNLVVLLDPKTEDLKPNLRPPLAELPFSQKVMSQVATLKTVQPGLIVMIRLPLDERAVKRALRLAERGAEVIHLVADDHGRGFGKRQGDFLTRLIREVHLGLVEAGLREELTLLVSGGIAMAEHVAKAIICGADGVGIDLPLLVALGCRLCPRCEKETACPVELERVPVEWGRQRIVNLLGAWHSQLIEVLGAMGLREVRRLRGEVGRAMFFEDLEREIFTPLFGERHQSASTWSQTTEQAGERKAQTPAPDSSLDPSSLVSREFPLARGLVAACPSRFRNQLSKFKVTRSAKCVACGKCAEVCAYHVHVRAGGRMLAPRSYLCRGAETCQRQGRFCVEHCPQKALRVGPDPMWETLGDPRWTADLLVSTWRQAETGRVPEDGLEFRVGASGGGFDRIDFLFPEKPPADFSPEEVELRLPLNRRQDGRPEVTIGFPVYGGGMSFGSISLNTMISRARAYAAFDSFTCTGEGGYPDELEEYAEHVITQVATGLFGVREETIQRAPIVEFKYAQGAKPGLGGHLLGDKVTPAVARMREAVEGNALFSPFPFHSVYSVEDHKKHVDWIKEINPRALVSVKVSTPSDVDMVAVGSYYAGAHIIHLDGSYGGTGAAPDIAKKNIAMPIEYALPKVHRFLQQEGLREQMTLIASGGLRTAWDIAKAIALGADGVVIGTAEMVALECVRCGNCESGRGCPRGIATTDPELSLAFDPEWGSQRLINLFHSFAIQLQGILWRLGMKSVRELVGRSDLLVHHDYIRTTTQNTRRAINE